jgi:hypothetical protein
MPTRSQRSSMEGLPEVPVMNPDDPYCFLITPFDEDKDLVDARRNGIEPATRRFGFPCFRIDQIPSTQSIIDATRQAVADADFVVAELTGGRPNCYYEVGYAHALKRPVIHIIREGKRPHFDLAGERFLIYRDSAHLNTLLQEHILRQYLTSEGPADPQDSNRGRFGRRAFVDPFIATGRVRQNPDERAAELSFFVDVRVRSAGPKRPLRGAVTFFYHESFPGSKRERVLVRNGEAVLRAIETYGTFTLGIKLHQPKVALELDLSKLPGAGAEFRSR